jgi:hypothetical protein
MTSALAAYDLGVGLGTASVVFSRGQGAGWHWGDYQRAADFLKANNNTDARLNTIKTEQDCVTTRQRVEGEIAQHNQLRAKIYNLGLHLGLGWGQLTAEGWPNTSQPIWFQVRDLAVRGLNQAQDNLRSMNALFFSDVIRMLQGEIDKVHAAPAFDPNFDNTYRRYLELRARIEIWPVPD